MTANLIDGLRSEGHEIVFLQPNRDLQEAGTDLRRLYRWHDGRPDIDALMLEWRWPIPGRNNTPCGMPGHTCDLHRQHDLLTYYTDRQGLPTVVWDKDRQLPADDPLRSRSNVTVCEAALYPTKGAVSLLFPVADAALDADPNALAGGQRPWPLTYVGNQYDRDEVFTRYFAPAAAQHQHRVAGKWPRTEAWPHVTFIGRVPFPRVHMLYSSSVSTILLLPDRLMQAGQMTQRLAEAVLAGCVPLAPAELQGAGYFVPDYLHVRDGAQAAASITRLMPMSLAERADAIGDCLAKLDIMRASRQISTLLDVLGNRQPRHPQRPPQRSADDTCTTHPSGYSPHP
ncbi:hypothetical protein [Actinomadura alba]|uniref:hypothetical protein n=1 Tax=Actinomadura alba TaxID=406431 RepID=UPI001C9CC468|nr:hypothetical protein [Actinomadura alba]